MAKGSCFYEMGPVLQTLNEVRQNRNATVPVLQHTACARPCWLYAYSATMEPSARSCLSYCSQDSHKHVQGGFVWRCHHVPLTFSHSAILLAAYRTPVMHTILLSFCTFKLAIGHDPQAATGLCKRVLITARLPIVPALFRLFLTYNTFPCFLSYPCCKSQLGSQSVCTFVAITLVKVACQRHGLFV
jgi:hypothetical protein